MGFFGDDKTAEIEGLKANLGRSEERRKQLAAALTDEKKRSAELAAQIEVDKAEIEQLKAVLMKARQRQKASVERANRYKNRKTINM